jgi:hypothetical protein
MMGVTAGRAGSILWEAIVMAGRLSWLLAVAAFIGCDLPQAQPAPQRAGIVPLEKGAASGQPAAIVPPPSLESPTVPVLAQNASGYWTQAQVETWLIDRLRLKELRLRPTGNHGYEGNGTPVQGSTYHLVVIQVPGGIRCNFTVGSAVQGSIAFGNYVPE